MAKKSKTEKPKGKKGGTNLGRSPKLTPKERLVIDAYFTNGFIKTKAMESQGYKWAHTNTYEFFHRPLVKAEIARREQLSRNKFEITSDNVKQELAAIAFSRLSRVMEVQPDGTAVINLTDMTEAERAAISEFTVEEYADGTVDADGNKRQVKKIKIKLYDKSAALDKLMRHLGEYKDKVEVGGDADIVALLLAGRQRVAQEASAVKP